jgi:hypothetical protein
MEWYGLCASLSSTSCPTIPNNNSHSRVIIVVTWVLQRAMKALNSNVVIKIASYP